MRNPDGSLDTFRPEETVALLADEQIDAIRPFAEELEIPADQLVLREGQTELDFLVVLRGGIEFSATDSFGKKNIPIVRLPERSFTGDLSFFTNTPLVGDGRTTGATRILRVRHSDFRRLLSAEPDLAAVILRAFVLRQGFKFRHAVGAVVLIGKASDPDILKLRAFLSRSDYPHNPDRARVGLASAPRDDRSHARSSGPRKVDGGRNRGLSLAGSICRYQNPELLFSGHSLSLRWVTPRC